ncbi:MAG: hypothetical protein KA194_09295, partial [Alcaligenes sp.]|nr:hypothetical protein [Alcaligenes sp.]
NTDTQLLVVPRSIPMILPMIFYLTKRLIAKANCLMKCIWGTPRTFQEQQPYFFNDASGKSRK